ncbi:hypothetical protein VTH06DRAFT_2249 [Thermothelomyces fergusii]
MLRVLDPPRLNRKSAPLSCLFPCYLTPTHLSQNRSRFRAAVDLTVKTFSNLLNSVHHPFAGARCSASSGAAADSVQSE